jgi:hypothetical protein
MTTGDSALFPTFVFMTYILPRYFGWRDVFAGRPKLAAWWSRMQQDTHAKRVSGHEHCSWQCLVPRVISVSSRPGTFWLNQALQKEPCSLFIIGHHSPAVT